MRCSFLIFLAFAGYTAQATPPNEHCSQDAICVAGQWIEQRELVFNARNLSEFPITVTVRVRSSVTGSRDPFELTQTVAGKSEVELARFGRADQSAPRPAYRFNYEWGFGVANVDHDDRYRYRLPYANGKRYGVLQGYGSRFSHTGREYYCVDFNMKRGTPVHAAREGIVMDLVERHGEGCWEQRCMRTANYLKILHDDGSTGEYYHLLRDGVLVERGERVERGQPIALSGNSGHSTMPHLHFGVYESISWGRTQSIDVQFDSAAGPVTRPRRGAGYVAR